ncbi:MAG: SET domain-containing protein-lysine N-methyltransferase [Parachlamydiales bacterium]|nr:SET domain-containing protein-lysine N-methyltransferase [Parachlamydiales bacterium]
MNSVTNVNCSNIGTGYEESKTPKDNRKVLGAANGVFFSECPARSTRFFSSKRPVVSVEKPSANGPASGTRFLDSRRPVENTSPENQYAKMKTPKQRPAPYTNKRIDLGNGRKYIDGIEFESNKEMEAFFKLWEKTEIPKQSKSFKQRCDRYFAAMKKTGQDPALKWVSVSKSEHANLGMGVKAIRKIPEGTLIGHYGAVIRKIDDEDSSRYIFKFEKVDLGKWYLDAAKKGSVLTCMNDNGKAGSVQAYEYFSKSGPRIIFIADRDIEEGEELFFSYTEDYWNNIGIKLEEIEE